MRSDVVVVAAHPDDEVIGAGGLLQRLGGACAVVHVTDGAPREMGDARAAGFDTREGYAAARRREAGAALALAGVAPERVLSLGAADQEASFALADLTRRLAALLRELRPSLVITHAYEGGHPDHDAAALLVHAAGGAAAVAEMTSYHDDPSGRLVVGRFLAAAEPPNDTVLALTAAERDTKRRMLGCFATQQETLRPFVADGALERELFRPAPRYRFTAPPHEGTLRYERYAWGVRSGAEWRPLAAGALSALGLSVEDPL